jgi:acyl-CoA synthetase (AMP-forming)/AMP-acid ligase II
MSKLPLNHRSLREAIAEAEPPGGRWLRDARASLPLGNAVSGRCLSPTKNGLAGRNVLLATSDQMSAALALIELDSVAERIVLCPPDLPPEHLQSLAAVAMVNLVVTAEGDTAIAGLGSIEHIHACRRPDTSVTPDPADRVTTWVLMTSGTSGPPKLVSHDLETLGGHIKAGAPIIWSTFYDIRRYGGLQIFLRALLGGGSLVLSDAKEAIADTAARFAEAGVTHVSGTPSHWRWALMSQALDTFRPDYVRLSGEIADQAILDNLRAALPSARIVHAFASTEAGLGFEVKDEKAGFPAAWDGTRIGDVDIRILDDTLRLRSPRAAHDYQGPSEEPLHDAEGFVDTGDVVERSGDRLHFAGRRGGIINVGGLKIHPEEVEQLINRHPAVQMSLVKARKSPLTGAIVVADVQLRAEERERLSGRELNAVSDQILSTCRAELPVHKVPVLLKFVKALELTPVGKLQRRNA